jgi:hypothetical protein
MKNQKLSVIQPEHKPDGYFVREEVMPGEIRELSLEFISIKGPYCLNELSDPGFYYLLLSLNGKSSLGIQDREYGFSGKSITRIPFSGNFSIKVNRGDVCSFLLIKKQLDKNDMQAIEQNASGHSGLYLQKLSECPVYTEDIKSNKTVNRMILPVGLIPRFCIGTVETAGPDSVGEHEHPMLDQLFLGLENCRCTCHAGGESLLLTENLILHIPLGSRHSVTVEAGDVLSYIWFDAFFTIKGQDYIEEQHKIDDK